MDFLDIILDTYNETFISLLRLLNPQSSFSGYLVDNKLERMWKKNTRCLKKSFTMICHMLLYGECYENVYTY
jgi:hypothetical protein